MKKSAVLLVLMMLGSILLNAATLHTILISATDDPSIGKGALINHTYLKKQLKEVEQATLLKYQLTEITQNINVAKILSAIEQLNTQADDVIFFYYSGHGLNSGHNKWPAFLIPGRTKLALDEVYEMLKIKPHRLLLTIGDCCNLGGALGNDPNYLATKSKSTPNAVGLKKLFLEATGNFLVSSSAPTQSSSYFDNIGGIYTSAFSDALRNALQFTSAVDLHWSTIFEETALLTKDFASVFNKQQEPQLLTEQIVASSTFLIAPYEKEKQSPILYFFVKVKKGEGLYQVADRVMKEGAINWHKDWKSQQKALAEKIAKWNNLNFRDILKTGQELKIDTFYIKEMKSIK